MSGFNWDEGGLGGTDGAREFLEPIRAGLLDGSGRSYVCGRSASRRRRPGRRCAESPSDSARPVRSRRKVWVALILPDDPMGSARPAKKRAGRPRARSSGEAEERPDRRRNTWNVPMPIEGRRRARGSKRT